MNALIPQAALSKKTFTQLFDAFKANLGDGIAPDGVLTLTPGTKDTDPKWQARFKVEPPSEGNAESRKAAVDQLKSAMERQIGPEGANEVFKSLGLEGATELSGRHLQRMEQTFNNVQKRMVRALENENRQTVQSIRDIGKSGNVTPDPGTDLSIEKLLEHPEAEWSIAGSGATGALIVKLPGGKGSVIKIETKEATEKVAKLSGVMQETLPEGPDGFNVPRVETLGDLTTQSPTIEKLITKLETLRSQTTDLGKLDKIDRHLNNLKNTAGLKDMGVSKMEFVPGVQLNQLPLDQRVAMLQTGRLAEQLGKAVVFCPVAGLNDHVTTRPEGTTNLSNFMLDPTTGKLAPIDLDSQNLAADGQTPFFGSPGATQGLKKIIDFTKNATENPENLHTAMEQMIAEQKTGVPNVTPFAQTLKSLTDPSSCEGLILPDSPESRLTKGILESPSIREKQALSMMRGTLAGLKELKENKEALKESFTTQQGGITPEEFEDLSQSVEGLDFEKMEQELDAYELDMNQRHAQTAQIKRDQQAIEDRAPIRPELDKLTKQQAKLERLENNPNRGDKIKAFFTRGGMEKLKTEAKLDIEKTQLQIASKMDAQVFDKRLQGNKEKLENLREAKLNAPKGTKEEIEVAKQLKKDVKQAEKVDALGEKVKNKSVREATGLGSPKQKTGQKERVGHGI